MYINYIEEVNTHSIRVTQKSIEEYQEYYLIYGINLKQMKHFDEYLEASNIMHHYHIQKTINELNKD